MTDSWKVKHGKRYSPEYGAWSNMKQRCLNPNISNYSKYGGRGIKVCDEWMSFEGFIGDIGERPSNDHSLDRIDNDGNYELSNCKWSTAKEQANNRSTTLPGPDPSEKTCPSCEETFMQKRKKSKYCSRPCQFKGLRK